jgi:hypothetical protein
VSKRPHEGVGGGRSLRDWFAGQALAAWIARQEYATVAEGGEVIELRRIPYSTLAVRSYMAADAMLAERDREPQS